MFKETGNLGVKGVLENQRSLDDKPNNLRVVLVQLIMAIFSSDNLLAFALGFFKSKCSYYILDPEHT